jgi:uncharacterized protein with von Willebrand factor type A (vWA) domain
VAPIILLAKEPRLVELAEEVAKKNLGRVFWADPQNLAKFFIEDFFPAKDS